GVRLERARGIEPLTFSLGNWRGPGVSKYIRATRDGIGALRFNSMRGARNTAWRNTLPMHGALGDMHA
ncbi:MAG TPA: hypothetical protein PKY87_13405, partial [Terricaulis sp.]|nr:hypothetical protein [Terricaulis sp.]